MRVLAVLLGLLAGCAQAAVDKMPMDRGAQGAAAQEKVALDGMIVRPESFTRWFVGSAGTKSYFENVDEFIDKAALLKPRVLYVEFRAVDSAMSGKNGRTDMRGALYF